MSSAFSPAQIDRYLSYINIPPRYHRTANPALDFDFLSALHQHQISRCPYENLTLHYSPSHQISLDPQVLYQKIVGDARGRGGYCMENSIFFNHVLRGLGFQVYTAGAKIRHRVGGVPEGDYIGWVHLVNVVVLKEKDPKTGEIVKRKYALDVSFGGDGPRCPLPMAVDGPGHSTAITKNIGTQELRLIHDFIPSQIHRSEEDCAQKMWIYQYRNRPELPWNSFYAFPEFEFTEQDFHVMNWYTGSHPESFQTFTVLVVRFLKKPAEPDAEIGEKRGEICGKVMMVNGEVKQNLGGRTEIIKTCKNEEERVAALKEYFDIKLAQEEIDSIKGRVTELREAALTA